MLTLLFFCRNELISAETSQEIDKNQELLSDLIKAFISSSPSNPSSSIKFEPNSAAAPLMPLSKQLPINLSTENREKYLNNKHILVQEAQKNSKLLQSRSIPWEIALSLLIVLMTILLIRLSPPPEKKTEREALNMTLLKDQILAAIERLSKENDKNYIVDLTRLDHELRHYIDLNYHLDISVSTTPEAIKKISQAPQLPSDARVKLTLFLQHADMAKFTGYTPLPEERQATLQAAHQLLED